MADILKLIAFDADDLSVLSAHAQDMLLKVEDVAWLPADQTFVMAGDRFDWAGAGAGGCHRLPSGLHFNRVLRVRRQGIEPQATLNLLSMQFEETDAPAGVVTLAFSGGAAIRLDVECLEAHLRDLGERYPVPCAPEHQPI